jgi:hypothetical protein
MLRTTRPLKHLIQLPRGVRTLQEVKQPQVLLGRLIQMARLVLLPISLAQFLKRQLRT